MIKTHKDLAHLACYCVGHDDMVRVVHDINYDNVRYFRVNHNGFDIGESIIEPYDTFMKWFKETIGNTPHCAISYYRTGKSSTDRIRGIYETFEHDLTQLDPGVQVLVIEKEKMGCVSEIGLERINEFIGPNYEVVEKREATTESVREAICPDHGVAKHICRCGK